MMPSSRWRRVSTSAAGPFAGIRTGTAFTILSVASTYVLEAAWFGMANIPNCFVQQLMPTSGLTTRNDLIDGHDVLKSRRNEDVFSDSRHELDAESPCLRVQEARIDEFKQLRVETATSLRVQEGHPGLLALRVQDGPLLEGERIVGEDQRQRPVAWRSRADERYLKLPGQALHVGHGHVPLEPDVIRQQDAERRFRDRDVAGLIQRLVVEHHKAVAGDQQQRARRIVLEPHAAGPFQPDGALRDAAVGCDLEKARLQGPEAIEIGLDPAQIRLVLRGGSEACLR